MVNVIRSKSIYIKQKKRYTAPFGQMQTSNIHLKILSRKIRHFCLIFDTSSTKFKIHITKVYFLPVFSVYSMLDWQKYLVDLFFLFLYYFVNFGRTKPLRITSCFYQRHVHFYMLYACLKWVLIRLICRYFCFCENCVV